MLPCKINTHTHTQIETIVVLVWSFVSFDMQMSEKCGCSKIVLIVTIIRCCEHAEELSRLHMQDTLKPLSLLPFTYSKGQTGLYYCHVVSRVSKRQQQELLTNSPRYSYDLSNQV